MAIGAVQLDDWPSWAAANRFQVECMVQLDSRSILPVFADYSKFRMAVGQVVNVLRVKRRRAGGSKIGVAIGTGFFAGGGNIYAPAMLGVTSSAVRGTHLNSVVDRTVMARETSLILDLG